VVDAADSLFRELRRFQVGVVGRLRQLLHDAIATAAFAREPIERPLVSTTANRCARRLRAI
jgi:hypothetical protein